MNYFVKAGHFSGAHLHAIAQRVSSGQADALRFLETTEMTSTSNPRKDSKSASTTRPTASAAQWNARAATTPNFDALPDSALVRQAELVRDPRRPARPTPLPISPATFWRKVKDGSFPQPVKLSARVTAWKVGEVRAWIEAQTKGE